VVLSFDVVAVFLVLVHISKGLVEQSFQLIGRPAHFKITHLYDKPKTYQHINACRHTPASVQPNATTLLNKRVAH